MPVSYTRAETARKWELDGEAETAEDALVFKESTEGHGGGILCSTHAVNVELFRLLFLFSEQSQAGLCLWTQEHSLNK